MDKVKNAALVLSSGGPRGFAYIGAIEEIEKAGYDITSVAGTSMGSLIGGMYAAGKLDIVKEWFYGIDTWKMLRLADFTFSMNHLVKGVRVIDALKEMVPDVNIEDLPIPFRAVATDLYTGEEVVFDRGSLFNAIRASISLPSLFRPVKNGIRTMIDGGIVNPLPLEHVNKGPDDILIALNVNYIDVENTKKLLLEAALDDDGQIKETDDHEPRGLINRLRNIFSKEDQPEHKDISDIEDNYYTVLSQSFSLMIHRNTELALRAIHPDILVNIPYDAFGEFDYDKAEEIAETGRKAMKEALAAYSGR